MVPGPYRYCFKLFDFYRSCKILFGLVKFKTAPDRMSGNVWEVFVNTAVRQRRGTVLTNVSRRDCRGRRGKILNSQKICHGNHGADDLLFRT